jgi:hypothetical protein
MLTTEIKKQAAIGRRQFLMFSALAALAIIAFWVLNS